MKRIDSDIREYWVVARPGGFVGIADMGGLHTTPIERAMRFHTREHAEAFTLEAEEHAGAPVAVRERTTYLLV